MKTSKKGFTLIELIVVIAIIGVLAAILVPAMLGYVKKSKISAANSAASSIDKAIDSTLTDIEAAGGDISGAGRIDMDSDAVDVNVISSSQAFKDGIKQYFSDIKKVRDGYAFLYNGTCVAVACTVDNTYWGSVPSGLVTPKNSSQDAYKSENLLEKAKEAANYAD